MPKKKPAPNPHGRVGDKMKIKLPFEDALRAALGAKAPKNQKRRP